jgi:hypothetical protein
MKKRHSKHIQLQFFAHKEALPESEQFSQGKFVAKCHTMVRKIHSSNSMQIQYTKNSGCCFLVQEAFFMSFLDCQGFLEVRIKLIRSHFSIQVCGSVMKTLMCLCQQTYVPFSNIKSKVISEIMSSQAKKLNQHSAAAAEGTYKNEDEKEKGL